MDQRKRIDPSDKVGVRLTQRQRKLIIDETYADDDLLKEVRPVRVDGKVVPVRFILDDWDELQGEVAAASNHQENKKTSNELLDIFEKIQNEVFDKYNDQD